MSAPIAKSQFAFELPNLTYVDTSLEEANLRAPVAPRKRHGLSALLAAFAAWREKRATVRELEAMSDRDLADIGLNRADIGRIFDAGHNQDLLGRPVA